MFDCIFCGRSLLVSFVLQWALTCCSLSSAAGTLEVESLGQLEADAKLEFQKAKYAATPDSSDSQIEDVKNAYRKTAIYKKIHSADSRQLCWQLIDTGIPELQPIGLICFLDKFPDDAFLAACRQILTANKFSLIQVIAMDVVRSHSATEEEIQELAIWLNGPSIQMRNVATLMSALTDQHISDLAMSKRIERFPLIASIIAGEIRSREKLSDNIKLSQRSSALIVLCRQSPGIPRVYSLLLGSPTKDEELEMLSSVLKDNSIDNLSLMPIVIKYGESHKAVLDDAIESASGPRSEMLKTILESLQNDRETFRDSKPSGR